MAAATPISHPTMDCRICLEACVAGSHTSAIVTLICGHTFHLSCIGCEFNIKGKMECPLCRVTEDSDWKYCIGIPGDPRLWEDEEEMATQYYDHEVDQGLAQEVHESVDGVRIALDTLNVLLQRTNAELARVTSAINENNANFQFMEEEEAFPVQNLIQDFMVPFPVENHFQEPFPGNNDIAAGGQLNASEVNPPPISQVSSEVLPMGSENEREAEGSPPPKRVRLFGRFIG